MFIKKNLLLPLALGATLLACDDDPAETPDGGQDGGHQSGDAGADDAGAHAHHAGGDASDHDAAHNGLPQSDVPCAPDSPTEAIGVSVDGDTYSLEIVGAVPELPDECGMLMVKITDAAGDAVEGATVHPMITTTAHGGHGGAGAPKASETDDAGVYHVTGLEYPHAGTWNYMFHIEGDGGEEGLALQLCVLAEE